MNKAKRMILEKKGWKVGTAEEFLGLSPVESRYIELKVTESLVGRTAMLRLLPLSYREISKMPQAGFPWER